MKKLLILFTLSFFAVTNAQKSDKALIIKLVDKYNKASSISYNIDYKIKYFDNDDTTALSGKCKLIRDIKDTIFNGKIWIDAKTKYGNYTKYYNIEALCIADHETDSITRFNPKKGQTYPITGAADGDFINTYFLKPQRLLTALNDKTYTTSISDSLNYAIMKIAYPDDEESTSTWKKVYINKKNMVIDKIQFYTELQDQYQYNEWKLSNIKFDEFTDKDLDKTFNEFKYPITDYQEPTEEDMAPLSSGLPAPDFTAKIYPQNNEVKLSDYKGKIVLLDYWYMSCYYCVKAMPSLSNLQQKYKNDIVVLGVNAHDANEKNVAKLPAFIERNKPAYQFAFIDFDVVKSYNVHGFPTLYIIDEDGIIQHSEIGYSDDYEADLEKIIIDLLGK